jgi:hypothetical protein
MQAGDTRHSSKFPIHVVTGHHPAGEAAEHQGTMQIVIHATN